MTSLNVDFRLAALIACLVIISIYFLLKYIRYLATENSTLKNEILTHSEELRAVETAARKDSTKRQRAILKGQISETLAPWSIDAVDSVKELSFLGNPIDFVGFKGLDGEGDIEIKFIEIKTGNSKLTKSEKRIRDAVKAKRVEWCTIYVTDLPEVVSK